MAIARRASRRQEGRSILDITKVDPRVLARRARVEAIEAMPEPDETPEPQSMHVLIFQGAMPAGSDMLTVRNAFSERLANTGLVYEWGAGSYADAVDIDFDLLAGASWDAAVDAVRDAALAMGLSCNHIAVS